MVLSQRERYIAIIAGSCLALVLLYTMMIGPYFTRRGEIAADIDKANVEQAQADALFRDQAKMRKIWKEMLAGGLSNTPSEADSQLQLALDKWAEECGVNVSSLQNQQSTPEGKFLQIRFHLTGTGPLATISNLLWRIETTSMPLRISEIQIVPRKEGVDDLQFQLVVSTLCKLPDSDKSARQAGATADASGGRP
jgi:hypothetical protein